MHTRRTPTLGLSRALELLAFLLTSGALGVSLTGCGPGGGIPDADTGVTPDAEPDAGFAVTPPNIDWLGAGVPPIAPPSLTPCPEGWREVAGTEAGDPVTCAPYPEGGPLECADGWAHFIGEPACTPVGAECPLGDFPEGLPSDSPVLYVLPGASGGGDGSEGAPLTTIAEAMGLASPGTVIALAKGVYDEAVFLGAGVTLWGACAAETRLTVSSPPSFVRGVVQVFAADARLQNVRIGPAEIPGLLASGPRADVTAVGVLIEGTRSAGLMITDSGRVHGHTLCVSNTRADSSGLWGLGVWAQGESSAELTRVLLSGNRHIGVYVTNVGTSLTLTDVVVRETQGRQSDGHGGRGLAVHDGAAAEVTRALFARNRTVGVYVASTGTSLTLTDIVVRNTQSQQSDGRHGRGLGVELGAMVDVTRALVEHNREIGIFMTDLGTSVTLTDLVIRDTQGQQADGQGGRGLGVELGATANVARALFARNREGGIFAASVGTSLTLTDLVVRDTQGQESGQGGRGLNVQNGATTEVSRALFARNREAGISVASVGTSVTLTDLVVRDTQGRESDRRGGHGLTVQDGATAEVTRALVERNRYVGVAASGVGASLTLADLVTRDTQSQESDGQSGRGLNVQLGATADVTRALFAGNHDVGVLAASEGTIAQLTDILVEDTAEQACAATACPERAYGMGLGSLLAANITATRFAVADSALCGVFLAADGELTLSAGRVSGSPVGVCLQVEGYDVMRLTEGVRYIGNGTNLDATDLPLPDVSDPVSDM